MFKKNNLKYIIILAVGFFLCSSIYLTQEQYLAKYADANFVNTVELLFGSLSMALGILVFGILYRKEKNIKMYYIISMILSIVSVITFFATKNVYLMGVCLCLTCFFGTSGFCAGYHFSLLGLNVEKKYRGRVFAIGYGFGSIGTYLLILLPENFYSTIYSLIIYIPLILINLLLVLKLANLEVVTSEKMTRTYKNFFIKISIVVLAMSLLSALSTDVIALYTINISGGYGSSRIYYCLGLLIAGVLVDKKENIFDLLVIVSFIFSLLAIVLLKDNYSINLIAALSYFFIGFFVLFRTISFINLSDKKRSFIFASAFGLMYSRIMEGIMVLFEENLIKHYTFLIVVISIVLSIVIVLFFLLYFQNKKSKDNDNIRAIALKYNLSIQEEKVLDLLLKNKNNQEIANDLFLSVNTIRNHIASIYKKTGMKKKELREEYYYRTS